jgi:NDP-sugar pyrophosphorylase family protein
VSSGRFDDIGTPASYLDTCLRMAKGDAAQLLEAGARVAPDARLRDSVCWSGAMIAPDVELDSCIVCSGAFVPRGSRYHRSVLLPADAVPAGPHDYRDGALTVSPID